MNNRHHVTNQLLTVNGERLFTETGWERVVSPRINTMPVSGGCICILLNAQPDRQNVLDVTVATFGPEERKAIRKAVERVRTKRRAQS